MYEFVKDSIFHTTSAVSWKPIYFVNFAQQPVEKHLTAALFQITYNQQQRQLYISSPMSDCCVNVYCIVFACLCATDSANWLSRSLVDCVADGCEMTWLNSLFNSSNTFSWFYQHTNDTTVAIALIKQYLILYFCNICIIINLSCFNHCNGNW